MLSPNGKIAVDERTNALIITDVARQPRRRSRGSRCRSTPRPRRSRSRPASSRRSSTFLRQIGIQWGGSALASVAGGNATGLIWPSSIARHRRQRPTRQTTGTGVASPSDFAVNLPAATGTGEGGALGLSLGSVAGNFNINLRLSALEDTGTVRIISAPEDHRAQQQAGEHQPGRVDPDLGRVGRPAPRPSSSRPTSRSTSRRRLAARLRDRDEPRRHQERARLRQRRRARRPDDPAQGGAAPRCSSTTARPPCSAASTPATPASHYKKVPFLGDLPVLGWLFKNRRENDDRTEILVFITPKITNKALLRCK